MSLDVILQYFKLGFTHVIPLGFDHILFIITLFFLSSDLRSVAIQCSIFTLAHSISLGLSAAGFVMPNSAIIEPLIALSILFTAVENIIHNEVNPYRLLIVFVFGLIHGMGFASALKDIGIPQSNFISTLLSFNLGVEAGQVLIILLAFFLVGKWFRDKVWYKSRIVYPVSGIIVCIALYWTIERIFFA